MSLTGLLRVLCVSALCCLAAPAQVAEKANAHYQTEEQRRQMAQALLRPGRDRQQKPRELVAGLAIQPGMTVADIGTGAGYMLPFLSQAVGPSGRVIAEDIFPDFIRMATERAQAEHLANVTTVLGTETNPNLPAAGVDLEFALEVYHHLNYPNPVLRNLRKALRRGGRLVIVDYYRRPGALPGGDAMAHIRADQPEVIREVESNGYRLELKRDHIPGSQYILIFQKTPRGRHSRPRLVM